MIDIRYTAALAVVGVGCVEAAAAARKPARDECFEVTTAMTSRSTRAVFAARHCQGGGVTWAPILRALVRRRGTVEPVDDPTSGWPGAVYALNGKTLFAIDEESDAALFCAADRNLLSSLRGEFQRLNREAKELKRAMAEASAFEMECREADGTVPKMREPPTHD